MTMRPTPHTAKLLRETQTDIDARIEDIKNRDLRRSAAIAAGDIPALERLKAEYMQMDQPRMATKIQHAINQVIENKRQAAKSAEIGRAHV